MIARFSTTVSALALLLISQSGFLCSQPKSITILHTNDLHASFLPHEAVWIRTDPKPMAGGFHELARAVDSIRAGQRPVLLLDGGDVMTGSPISDYEYRGALGGALFAMMNLIGYDAWAIGNHDLDVSQDNLRGLTDIASFPSLSANLMDSAGNLPLGNKEYVIVQKGGLRIGIIGFITSDLFNVTNTNNLIGLRVDPPTRIAQKIIDKLDPETDLIIALTHEGVQDDSLLATSTHGLDIIVGGHSHTRLRSPKFINGVIIVQAGSNSENLGVLNITVDGDSVTAFDGKLLSLWAHDDQRNLPVDTLIDEFRGKIETEYGEVIGTLGTSWQRSRDSESNIGTYLAEAIRQGSGADIAVTNGSGIRKDLGAGNIRKLDLFEIAPFRNYLSTVELSGEEVRKFVQRFVEMFEKGQSALQISGLQVEWRKNGETIELSSIKIGDKPLVPENRYTLGTTDFVLNQADKYLGFIPSNVKYSRTTMYEALVAAVKKDKSVSGAVPAHLIQLQ